MSKAAVLDASRPEFDEVIQDIVDYVLDYDVTRSDEAMQTARYDWMGQHGLCAVGAKVPGLHQVTGAHCSGCRHAGPRGAGSRYRLRT